ncbi:condensation domain-containing protein [Massilia sp. W12]|uniref:condensation domain-containing protein n=1 Tax=Massilia sp. W12 TaxID=3126507 RepID=UPI0030D48422
MTTQSAGKLATYPSPGQTELSAIGQELIAEGVEFPLGYAQLCFWVVYEALGETANNLSRLMIDGEVQVGLMEKAINLMLQRHDSLRASISKSQPVQKIMPHQAFDLAFFDGAAASEAEFSAMVGKISHQMVDQAFDLSQAPLLRAHLCRRSARQYVMLLCFPHIIADGGAVHLFEQQLMDTYRRLSRADAHIPGRAQTLQIANFVEWERQRNAQHGAAALQFWREKLHARPYATFPDALLAKGALQETDHYANFPAASFTQLADVAKRHKASLQMALLAVIACAVFRVTGQTQFSINSVLESRDEHGTEGLMAALLRVMPVPFSFTGELSFEQVLQQVRQHVLQAYEHRDCPWSIPVGILAEQRWRQRPAGYLALIKACSKIYAKVFARAKLYPRFLADFWLMEAFPPENWRAVFAKKPPRAERGGVAAPVLNVNILQSAFKRETNQPSQADAADKEVRAAQLTDPTQLLLSEAVDNNWEEDSINFYILDTGHAEPSIRMICSNLNETGVRRMIAAVEDILRTVSVAPHTIINQAGSTQ